jgi:50S ribosomal subunit-associated GTPase HflX
MALFHLGEALPSRHKHRSYYETAARLLFFWIFHLVKLPHELVASFHATLEEALAADLLLVLVDGSSPDAAEQLTTVNEVLESLDAADIARITVLNKLDLIEDRTKLAELWQKDAQAVAISVHSGEGLDALNSAIQERLSDVENRCALMVPHTAGGLLAHIREKATVISEFYTQQGCLIEVQASPALLGRLLSEGARYAEAEDLPEGVKGIEIPDDEPPTGKQA